jgi:hypothetical protein
LGRREGKHDPRWQWYVAFNLDKPDCHGGACYFALPGNQDKLVVSYDAHEQEKSARLSVRMR